MKLDLFYNYAQIFSLKFEVNFKKECVMGKEMITTSTDTRDNIKTPTMHELKK